MKRSWGRDYIESTLVSITNAELELFDDVPMEEVSELLIQITDAGAATSTCTIKLYGSIDDGATYHQVYTWLSTDNIHDPTAASATQTTSTTPICLYTNITYPMMKLTAQRAAASPANVTTVVKATR